MVSSDSSARRERKNVVQDSRRRYRGARARPADDERLGSVTARRERDEIPGASQRTDGAVSFYGDEPRRHGLGGRRHDVPKHAPTTRFGFGSRGPGLVEFTKPL